MKKEPLLMIAMFFIGCAGENQSAKTAAQEVCAKFLIFAEQFAKSGTDPTITVDKFNQFKAEFPKKCSDHFSAVCTEEQTKVWRDAFSCAEKYGHIKQSPSADEKKKAEEDCGKYKNQINALPDACKKAFEALDVDGNKKPDKDEYGFDTSFDDPL